MNDMLIFLCLPTFTKKLTKYRHNAPKRLKHCPYESVAAQCGRNLQETTVKVERKALDKEGNLRVQQVVCSLLYHVHTVDMILLYVLNSIAVDTPKPMERTMERVEQIIDYMHTDLNAVV